MNKAANNILKILSQSYPDPKTELDYRDPYQLLVAVSLSAQCTDKKVNEVTPKLFAKYQNFETLAKAKLTSVENIIRPINYYRTKSRNLIAASQMVSENYKGQMPRNHEDLIKIPGVGRKTANVILGELGITETLPVDTHVMRLARRLGLSSGKNPLEIENELMKKFDKSLWRQLHHSLILHGRRVCKAQNPQCSLCKLDRICPKIGVV